MARQEQHKNQLLPSRTDEGVGPTGVEQVHNKNPAEETAPITELQPRKGFIILKYHTDKPQEEITPPAKYIAISNQG